MGIQVHRHGQAGMPRECFQLVFLHPFYDLFGGIVHKI